MSKEAIPILSDLMDYYYTPEEFQGLAETFDVSLDLGMVYEKKWLPVIKELVLNVSHNNHQPFLSALVASMIRQAAQGVGSTNWERRDAHQNALYDLRTVEKILATDILPEEITVDENKHFTAKSETRQFLGLAETDIFIVDPYIGLGTLDCLLDTKQEVRILIGENPDRVEKDFERHLKDFCAEGRRVTVKRHPKLHDRHLFFNDRCWLLGSSLKDAGKKRLNCIEIVDGKAALREENERKWAEATPLELLKTK